jgi:hypothetical protein
VTEKLNYSARIYNALSGLGLFKSGRDSIGSGDSLVFADATISDARPPPALVTGNGWMYLDQRKRSVEITLHDGHQLFCGLNLRRGGFIA